MSLTACSNNEASFSSMPGFERYFAAHQPSKRLPGVEEQALLERYRPRVYKAQDQTGPIDFYNDYIGSGSLYSDGHLISDQVTPVLLNQYRDDPAAEFRHTPHQKATVPTVYGRINYDDLTHAGTTYPLTFLSYNLVFAHSGILKGLSDWQQWLLNTTGWNEDWHQLDHYVGLSIVLYQQRPLAIVFQQHNYQTTYLISKTKTTRPYSLSWPDDQRIAVDIALQSNELYPHNSTKTKHYGVSFISPENLEFMSTGENKPLMAGYDITNGEQEQEYTLKFLAPADAFYTFKGRLGEKRSLPGRDGPPGASYVTLPGLMPWANRLVTGFRTDNIDHERTKITHLLDMDNFAIKPDGLTAYRQDFIKASGLD